MRDTKMSGMQIYGNRVRPNYKASINKVMYKDVICKTDRLFKKLGIKVLSLCGIVGVVLMISGCSHGGSETNATVTNGTFSKTEESTVLRMQTETKALTIGIADENPVVEGDSTEVGMHADTSPAIENNTGADTSKDDTREENMTKETIQESKLGIRVGEELITATLEENSSAEALVAELEKGDITIDMHDYASFEKVGPLGVTLPTNDKQITTGPGDVILYQGNQFVIYYDTNSWNFTQLAKIDDLTQDDLKRILGDGDVSVTLTLIRD